MSIRASVIFKYVANYHNIECSDAVCCERRNGLEKKGESASLLKAAVPGKLFTKSEVAVHSSQHLSHPIA